jgi:hypothetical protein
MREREFRHFFGDSTRKYWRGSSTKINEDGVAGVRLQQDYRMCSPQILKITLALLMFRPHPAD